MLRTTINIDDISMNLLKKAALLKKKDESEIIEAVIKEAVRRYFLKRKIVVSGTVKYQIHNDDYVIYHYCVRNDLYEACLDLRKYYKLSVSRILNEAIKEVLGAMLRVLELNSHDASIPSGNCFVFMDNYELEYTSKLQIDLDHCEFSTKIRMRIT